MQEHFTEALQVLLKPTSELFDPGISFFHMFHTWGYKYWPEVNLSLKFWTVELGESNLKMPWSTVPTSAETCQGPK